MDELTPICQMKDLPLGGFTRCRRESLEPMQCFLLSGGVHQNSGSTTKYPCSVCTRNVTSCGVSYMCNRFSGWVHSKCYGWVHSKCSGWVHSKWSGFQNAAEYRRLKNWVYAALAVSNPLH